MCLVKSLLEHLLFLLFNFGVVIALRKVLMTGLCQSVLTDLVLAGATGCLAVVDSCVVDLFDRGKQVHLGNILLKNALVKPTHALCLPFFHLCLLKHGLH